MFQGDETGELVHCTAEDDLKPGRKSGKGGGDAA